MFKKPQFTLEQICDEIGVDISDIFVDKKDVQVSKIVCRLSDVQPNCVLFLTALYDTINVDKEDVAVKAYEKNALAVITDKNINASYIYTSNANDSFEKAANLYRKAFTAKAICITGSIGKTTATQMISHVVLKNTDSYSSCGPDLLYSHNTVMSAARTVQDINHQVDYIVQESSEAPIRGELIGISKILEPDIAVITRISDSHIEAFGSKTEIAKECLTVEEAMPDSGILFLNADDPYQMELKPKQKVITYGIENQASYYCAKNICYNENNLLSFEITYASITLPVEIKCIGIHNVYNALVAFAVGKQIGLDDDTIIRTLRTFSPNGIRQNLVFMNGQTVFLDCYNASSDSAINAVKIIDGMNVPTGGKRRFVFGKIGELGAISDDVHSSIADTVINSKVDTVFCLGEETKVAYNLLLKAGRETYYAESICELDVLITKHTQKKDLVLFKGSRSNHLEASVLDIYGKDFFNDSAIVKVSRDNIDYNITIYDKNTKRGVVSQSFSEHSIIHLPEDIDDSKIVGIHSNSFALNSKLKEIYMPKEMKFIGNSAFFACKKLKEVAFPKALLRIDAYAFSMCNSLTSIIIPNGVYHIGNNAFSHCRALRLIDIPDSLTYIGKDAFLNCSNKLVIRCSEDSLAHRYAKENGIHFELNNTPFAEQLIEDAEVQIESTMVKEPTLSSEIKNIIKKVIQ